MHIAVMGAGGVGSYFGARLASAGHRVTLIGRPRHVEAIRRDGLKLESRGVTQLLAVEATTAASGVAGADLVLVAVKSDDTESAGREMAAHLAPGAAVVSLQNGVDNAERLAATLGRPVIPAAVYVATEMAGDGFVRHHGRGELILGAGPRSEEIAVWLRAAGAPTTVSDRVAGALWAKLVLNCAYNALSAVSQLPYRPMCEVQGVREVMRDVVSECEAVASRLGVALPGDLLASVFALAPSMPEQYSSTAQDLARGRLTEIGHLNGFIVRQGEAHGVPTPVNRALLAMVRLCEAKAVRGPQPTSTTGP